jgi:predicted GNAT family N-acyltransferase
MVVQDAGPDGKKAAAKPQNAIRIERCVADDELESLYRFRHVVYVDELGWLSDDDGRLADDFDPDAFNYAAYDLDGRVVGSVRVVEDGEAGLPLDRCFDLAAFRLGRRLAEVCRLSVLPQYRTSRLPMRLMKTAYERAVLLDATDVVTDAYTDEAILYERLGFRRLGDPYHDDGYNCPSWVTALSQPVAWVEERWPAERPAAYRIFSDADPFIDHR